MTNAGGFEHSGSHNHGSGTEFAQDPAFAWYFRAEDGTQFAVLKSSHELFAMAARPGDVAAVPEPQTPALTLAGLTVLTVAARRRPR